MATTLRWRTHSARTNTLRWRTHSARTNYFLLHALIAYLSHVLNVSVVFKHKRVMFQAFVSRQKANNLDGVILGLQIF